MLPVDRTALASLFTLGLLPDEHRVVAPHAGTVLSLIETGLTRTGLRDEAFILRMAYEHFLSEEDLPHPTGSVARAVFLEYVLAIARGVAKGTSHAAPPAAIRWSMAFALRRLFEATGRAPQPHELAREGYSMSEVAEYGFEAAQLAELIDRVIEEDRSAERPASRPVTPLREAPALIAEHRHLSDEDIAAGHVRLGEPADPLAA